jgi:hypothetical protein
MRTSSTHARRNRVAGRHCITHSALHCGPQAQGGDLITLETAAKQRDVEAYFRTRKSLTGDYYWHGLSREGVGADLLFSSGVPAAVGPRLPDCA